MNEKYGIELELITNKFNEKINKIKKSFSGLKNEQVELKADTKQMEYLRHQIKQVEAELNKLKSIPMTSSDFNYKNILKAEASLEKLNNQYKKLVDKEKNVQIQSTTASNSLSKGIDKVSAKIKRFALSLFSIRSIYALVSRASSAYLSQDTSLANKLQAVWVGLGAILEPIISRIVNVMLKAVKYINVFVKALTGVDLLAKATSKSLGGTTKSAKALSKALAGFDELTNLDTTSDTSNSGLDTGWTDAFNDIQLNPELVQLIENFATKTRELKKAWDDLNPSVQNIIKILGLTGLLGILTGKVGLILGVGALVLGVDGLCKIFDNDLTNSVTGLIELLGVAGLIGILTGNGGLTMAIAGVSLALFRIK